MLPSRHGSKRKESLLCVVNYTNRGLPI